MVELVNTDDEVFGEDLLRGAHTEGVGLVVGDLQLVVGVDSGECGDAVVEVVFAFAHGEIDDVDGIHLLHLLIAVAEVHVVGDYLGNTIEYALQIVSLT